MGLKSSAVARWAKIPIFALCLFPVAHEVWLFLHDGLGANPVEHITHRLDVVRSPVDHGRTQVRLTDQPSTVGWTDVWLPEKAPISR